MKKHLHDLFEFHTAGRLGAKTKQAGDILINGRRHALAYGTSVSKKRSTNQNYFLNEFTNTNHFNHYCNAFSNIIFTQAYVTQEETFITTLTVREVVYYSAQLQLPNSMLKIEKKERADNNKRDGFDGLRKYN